MRSAARRASRPLRYTRGCSTRSLFSSSFFFYFFFCCPPTLTPNTQSIGRAINCHHNYVEKENHFGKDVYVTRKGAVRAAEGELGIIPGSMGTDCYIVRGKGNSESFCSCSHGAGREMSRVQARRSFSIQEHMAATEGIECRKDKDVLDETPMAYKPIAKVIDAQSDLIEVVARLKQIVCVKG